MKRNPLTDMSIYRCVPNNPTRKPRKPTGFDYRKHIESVPKDGEWYCAGQWQNPISATKVKNQCCVQNYLLHPERFGKNGCRLFVRWVGEVDRTVKIKVPRKRKK